MPNWQQNFYSKTMNKYSDAELAEIEQLKQKAAEKRLEKSLARLSKQFNSWKKKTIDSASLASYIKEWHFINLEGTKYTSGSDPGMPVAKALTEGDLRTGEISPELLSKLEILIEILKV